MIKKCYAHSHFLAAAGMRIDFCVRGDFNSLRGKSCSLNYRGPLYKHLYYKIGL